MRSQKIQFVFIALFSLLLMNCTRQKPGATRTTFTKADSLTDCYLDYQDSILQSWNVMINDDNQKVKALHNLLHELLITSTDDRDVLRSFEEQLAHLVGMRYNQQSLGNEDVVEEYDFASANLVSGLISMAESKPEFAYNTTLQNLVEEIRLADQRVINYREEYDYIVAQYNGFLERNRIYLDEISVGDTMHQKHLFKMIAGE
jgi:hypothetical protein